MDALRRAVFETDAELAIYNLRTVDDALGDEQSSNIIIMSLFIAVAIVAVLLAASGLYGVMAHAVSPRSVEIAVRMALGASRRDIGRQMAHEGIRLTTIGVAPGLAGTLVLAHTMASVLFGVTPTDIPTHGAVVLVTWLTALPAVWLPTRRAVRTDPMANLRA